MAGGGTVPFLKRGDSASVIVPMMTQETVKLNESQKKDALNEQTTKQAFKVNVLAVENYEKMQKQLDHDMIRRGKNKHGTD